MSTRAKKPKASPQKTVQEEEEKPQTPKKVEVVRPKGPAPRAVVDTRHEGEIITRASRGFSFGELRGSAMPLTLATRLGVPMDLRRRSTVAANVASLKKWFEHAPKAAAKVPQAQKVEKAPAKEEKVAPTKEKQKVEKPKKVAPKKRVAAPKKKAKN